MAGAGPLGAPLHGPTLPQAPSGVRALERVRATTAGEGATPAERAAAACWPGEVALYWRRTTRRQPSPQLTMASTSHSHPFDASCSFSRGEQAWHLRLYMEALCSQEAEALDGLCIKLALGLDCTVGPGLYRIKSSKMCRWQKLEHPRRGKASRPRCAARQPSTCGMVQHVVPTAACCRHPPRWSKSRRWCVQGCARVGGEHGSGRPPAPSRARQAAGPARCSAG